MNEPVEPRSGRVALVTGAASGIGLAIARSLAEHGMLTILSDIDEARGREVASQMANASFIAADLSDPDSCRQLAKDSEAVAGRIDVLVNNAGLQHVAPITDFAEARWRQLLEIMLTAPFLLTQSALPGMMDRRWGRIINMGSVHSLRASAYKSAYVAAKHGLLGLTRVTAIEAAPFSITCNAICPSYVRTPLVEKQIGDQARVHNIPESEVVEKIMATSSGSIVCWSPRKSPPASCFSAAMPPPPLPAAPSPSTEAGRRTKRWSLQQECLSGSDRHVSSARWGTKPGRPPCHRRSYCRLSWQHSITPSSALPGTMPSPTPPG